MQRYISQQEQVSILCCMILFIVFDRLFTFYSRNTVEGFREFYYIKRRRITFPHLSS